MQPTSLPPGLFDESHMQYHMVADPDTEPTLSEMVQAALAVLGKSPRGYFLFVEGGKIDLAHHKARARRALDETIEFAKAVETAQKLTSVKVNGPSPSAIAERRDSRPCAPHLNSLICSPRTP